MAERRSIHRKASVSDDLADLAAAHGGYALAFYLMLIPHYDRWGCVPDSSRRLKVSVMPMIDAVSAADIEGWVEWLVEHGDLERVQGKGGLRGLRNPTFHGHQTGARFERETPSPFEPPEVTAAWVRPDRENGKVQGGPGPGPDQGGTNGPKEGRKEGTSFPGRPPQGRRRRQGKQATQGINLPGLAPGEDHPDVVALTARARASPPTDPVARAVWARGAG